MGLRDRLKNRIKKTVGRAPDAAERVRPASPPAARPEGSVPAQPSPAEAAAAEVAAARVAEAAATLAAAAKAAAEAEAAATLAAAAQAAVEAEAAEAAQAAAAAEAAEAAAAEAAAAEAAAAEAAAAEAAESSQAKATTKAKAGSKAKATTKAKAATPAESESQEVVVPDPPQPEPAAAARAQPEVFASELAAAQQTQQRVLSVEELLNADPEHADAPTRNAYYREAFESTDQAMQVRVYNEDENLDVSFPIEPGEFILDAAERAGYALPFSCRSGGCLTCSAKAVEGTFEMDEQYVLEDEHIEEGYLLLCCTAVTSDGVYLSHQQDNIE